MTTTLPSSGRLIAILVAALLAAFALSALPQAAQAQSDVSSEATSAQYVSPSDEAGNKASDESGGNDTSHRSAAVASANNGGGSGTGSGFGSGSGGGSLPFTGLDLLGIVGVGAALLVAGTVLRRTAVGSES